MVIRMNHTDALANEVKVGDFIQFKSKDIMPYGQVIEITDGDKPKYVVRTLGWFGDENVTVKNQYHVNVDAKHIAKLQLQPAVKKKKKKDMILLLRQYFLEVILK